MTIKLRNKKYRGSEEIRAKVPYKLKQLAKQVNGYKPREDDDGDFEWGGWPATPIMAYRLVDTFSGHDLKVTRDIDRLCKQGRDIIEYDRSIEVAEYRYDTTPWHHQIEATDFMLKSYAALLHMEMGCFSADTEYLSPEGWKRFDEYDGGKVAQYHPDSREAEFVEPEEYVKLPCDKMIRFKHSRGLDQLLSPEHRMIIKKRPEAEPIVMQAEEVARKHSSHWRVPSNFVISGQDGINLTDEEIRLMVAVIADGHFPNQASTPRCRINIKKRRKKKRLKNLLKKCEIDFDEKSKGKKGYNQYVFNAPRREKVFGDYWWSCSFQQLKLIADECYRWDGSERKANAVSFCSTKKKSANFIQYAFSATGRTASINKTEREGRKPTTWNVHARSPEGTQHLTLSSRKKSIQWEDSPDGYKYCFVVDSSFLITRRNGSIVCSGNTGKSKCVVDWMQNCNDAQSLVIVGPKSAMNVWPREFRTHSVDDYKYYLSCEPEESVPDRIEDAHKKYEKAQSMDRDMLFICNYATSRRDEFKDFVRDHDIDGVVADESHRIKSAGSKQSKSFRWLHDQVQYRWCLTGTPMPNNPLDVYGQFRFLDQGVFGTQFKRFRSNFAIMGGYENKEVVGFKNEDELSKRMDWLTYRADESVLDLPEAHTIDKYIELPESAQSTYNELENQFWSEVQDGEVTAMNGLAKMLRLQQITSGYVTTDDEKDRHLHDKKQELLEEMIEGMAEKIVVFARFTRDLKNIEEVVESLDLRYGEVSGNRSDINDDAEMPEDIDVMGVQIQAGAEGIDLTEATVGIYYSMGFNLGNYRQSRRRLHRPGQEDSVRFFRIVAENTIDEKIIDALEDKQEVVDYILSLSSL